MSKPERETTKRNNCLNYIRQLISESERSDLHLVPAKSRFSNDWIYPDGTTTSRAPDLTQYSLPKLSELEIPKDAYVWINHYPDKYLSLYSVEEIIALIRILIEAENLDFYFVGSASGMRQFYRWLRRNKYINIDELEEWASEYASQPYTIQYISGHPNCKTTYAHYEELRWKAIVKREARQMVEARKRRARIKLENAKKYALMQKKQAKDSRDRRLSMEELERLSPTERISKVAQSRHLPYYYPCHFVDSLSDKDINSIATETKRLLVQKIKHTTSAKRKNNKKVNCWKRFCWQILEQ